MVEMKRAAGQQTSRHEQTGQSKCSHQDEAESWSKLFDQVVVAVESRPVFFQKESAAVEGWSEKV